MKVIVAGSRNITNKEFIYKKLDYILSIDIRKENEIEIVSGTARGVDRIGEEWAVSRKQRVKRFPANWNEFGKSAGYIRNKQMAHYAEYLIAFWDGKSKGTEHMINLAMERELKIRIVKLKD